MRTRNVVILGATGSIGQSARKVAKDIPSRMRIVGMSAHSNAEELAAAAREFPEARTVLSGEPDGGERLVELATMPEADLVLIAIVALFLLSPTWESSKSRTQSANLTAATQTDTGYSQVWANRLFKL
jgi:1-deoxy-D-xylulose-5-phosphate reductoisomerase